MWYSMVPFWKDECRLPSNSLLTHHTYHVPLGISWRHFKCILALNADYSPTKKGESLSCPVLEWTHSRFEMPRTIRPLADRATHTPWKSYHDYEKLCGPTLKSHLVLSFLDLDLKWASSPSNFRRKLIFHNRPNRQNAPIVKAFGNSEILKLGHRSDWS